MGEEGGIRCFCPLCYAFSKGENPIQEFLKKTLLFPFDSYAVAYMK